MQASHNFSSRTPNKFTLVGMIANCHSIFIGWCGVGICIAHDKSPNRFVEDQTGPETGNCIGRKTCTLTTVLDMTLCGFGGSSCTTLDVILKMYCFMLNMKLCGIEYVAYYSSTGCVCGRFYYGIMHCPVVLYSVYTLYIRHNI